MDYFALLRTAMSEDNFRDALRREAMRRAFDNPGMFADYAAFKNAMRDADEPSLSAVYCACVANG